MCKKRKKVPKPDSDFETKLFWFLATAYIAKAVGRLDAAKEEKLDLLSREHGGD